LRKSAKNADTSGRKKGGKKMRVGKERDQGSRGHGQEGRFKVKKARIQVSYLSCILENRNRERKRVGVTLMP